MPKSLEPTYVTYEDVTYAIYPFPAMTAVEVSGDLASFLGPIFSALIPLFSGASGQTQDELGASALGNLSKMNNEQVVPMIKDALTGVDGKTVRAMMTKLLIAYDNITCEYEDPDRGVLVQKKLTAGLLDELFIGNLDSMLLLAIDVVKVNFAGFFEKLLNRSGSRQAGLTSRKSKSTGSSTETVSVL